MWYTAKSISGKGFCRSVPMWRIAWAIKRTSEHDTSEHNTPTLWLSRWGARAEIRFIPDTKIAVYTPNAKWIQKCPHHAQHVVTKDDISAIIGLPFSFSWKEALEDLVIEFYFPSRLHSSSFYTFYFFLHIFSVNSLLSCPLFHSDVRSNFRIAQSLFFLFFFSSLSHFERWREFKSPPCLCPFFIHFFFPSKTLGCIKHNDILGEMPRRLCLWSVWPPQASLNLLGS